MSADSSLKRTLFILGSAVLLGCAIAGIWAAGSTFLPASQGILDEYGRDLPPFYEFAFRIWKPSLNAVNPLAFTGIALFVIALLGRGPARLVAFCRAGLPILAGLAACFAIYLLTTGGIGLYESTGAQEHKMSVYRRTLQRFALLEATEGRYHAALEAVRKQGDLKMVEARSASEFNNAEAREKIHSLIGILPEVRNAAMKRRVLATLALFRERIPKGSTTVKDLPRHAVEAGAPPTNSHSETLEWVAANLNKDGWKPLPLFKLSR